MGQKQIARVVLDTNVIISALLFGGTPSRLATLWQMGTIKPFASPIMVEEFLRVLAYPRFELNESEIEYLIYQQILPFFDIIDVEPGPTVVDKDPSDDVFLYCAVEANVDYIISGDRHLLALKSFRHIPIITPSAFLSMV